MRSLGELLSYPFATKCMRCINTPKILYKCYEIANQQVITSPRCIEFTVSPFDEVAFIPLNQAEAGKHISKPPPEL